MKTDRLNPFIYLITTLLWTWIFWFGAVLTGQSWLQFPTLLLTVLGFCGPFLVAVLMVKLGFWNGNVRGFLRNNFDLRLLSVRWYLYLLGFVLLLSGLPLLIGSLIFGQSINHLTDFSAPTVFILVGIIAGAIEEPGWRGYAQKGLQSHMSPLNGSILIGVVWALWHVPLFLLEGTYQHSVGFGTSGFWFFNASILAGSIFYAWLYNAAGQIGVIAVLYHGVGNAMREVLSFTDTDFTVQSIGFGVEAGIALVVLVLSWKFMTKRGEIKSSVNKNPPLINRE
ncbi:type II CAAX endopeptidase family protein [Chitinispirillales bacterium ANBcel5]|uniref:CPBP family glutamic-type intramembrane protease n=1 Tax=Cellulosispirillum alkaliphilum TaxID=3039283 RepID=UPI002A564914|nr:type II CAAX endopeptidase family protein [Chitinispirillales bacterium ANBcel5]